jgi:integrase
MMGRRARGEGSIYKRKDGSWVAESTAGGKKKYLYAKTKKAASERKREYEQGVQEGVRQEPEREMEATEFFWEWLASIEGTVKNRTLVRHENVVRLHLSALQGIALSAVRPVDLQRLYKEKLSTLSPRTVQIIHATIHKALKQAVAWDLVDKNVAENVIRPRSQPKEIRTLTREEVSLMLGLVKGERFEPVYVLAVTTGIRQGEILGLRWEDLDLDAGVLRIRRTLWKGETSTPKTRSSIRSIPLSAYAAETLRGYRARCEAGEFTLSEWMFSTSSGKPVNVHNVINRSWYPLLEKMGLARMPFHNLRHTCATLLLASNVHPKVVQSLLGHSSVEITLDTYSHVLPEMGGRVAEVMDEVLDEPENHNRLDRNDD